MSNGRLVFISGIGSQFSAFCSLLSNGERVIATENGAIAFSQSLSKFSLISCVDRDKQPLADVKYIDLLHSSTIVDFQAYCGSLLLVERNGLTFIDCMTREISRSMPISMSISQVSCGDTFALFLSHQMNAVFSMGTGNDGQLGLGQGITESLTEPTLIREFSSPLSSDESIIQISAGSTHCALLTNIGRIFTFGAGSFCKLGHGDMENVWSPKILEFSELLIGCGSVASCVSCGSFHSALATSSGDVYTWGWGKHGELGRCQEGSSIRDEIEAIPRLCDDIDLTLSSSSDSTYHICCGCRLTIAWSNSSSECKGFVFGRILKVVSVLPTISFLTFHKPTNIEELIEFIQMEYDCIGFCDRKRKNRSNCTRIESVSCRKSNVCLVVEIT